MLQTVGVWQLKRPVQTLEHIVVISLVRHGMYGISGPALASGRFLHGEITALFLIGLADGAHGSKFDEGREPTADPDIGRQQCHQHLQIG